MKRSGIEFLEKQAARLDLPANLLSRAIQMDITDGNRVHVENHSGLLEYEPDCICINGCGMAVCVRGRNLQIRAMTQSEISITGQVDSVAFQREDDR